MNDIKEIKVGTIRQILRKLKANGYSVSENALRRWVKAGMLPATYSGNVAYISYKAAKILLNPASASKSSKSPTSAASTN